MDIHIIPMGISRSYVIRDKGTVLIDSGPPGKLKTFLRRIEKSSIDPKQISLIIQTHGHWDHIGSAKAIKDNSRAKLAMHSPDSEWLEKSLKQIPPGVTLWGRILVSIMSVLVGSMKIADTRVDIHLPDNQFTLVPFGIPGKIIYTPGHTLGSVSVLLDSGEAFVGDLVMNAFPMTLRPGLPVFAEDIKRVKKSCRLLLDSGATEFYPGHGKPFPSSMLRRFLD